MRQIYNCEQIPIPRALSSNDIVDSSSRHSSFDDSIPTPTVKGQFDFETKARYEYLSRNQFRFQYFLFLEIDNVLN